MREDDEHDRMVGPEILIVYAMFSFIGFLAGLGVGLWIG